MRRVIGCMTGTSLDGLDAALVEIEGVGLAGMRAKFVRGVSVELGAVVAPLRKLAEQSPMTAGEIAGVMRDFSTRHVDAIRALIGGERVDLICVHGQTVFHKPPVSWQLLQPAPIVAELGVPVVFDLRAMDLAMGGQGAPITPIADAVFFAEMQRPFAVVNLGGFSNYTLCREGEAASDPREAGGGGRGHGGGGGWGGGRGGDVCPCNLLLDAIARTMFFLPFDADGARALAGEVHEDARIDLEGIFASLGAGLGAGPSAGLGASVDAGGSSGKRPKRSLGTGDEVTDWISRFRAHVRGEDLAATACVVIADAIADHVREAETVLLAGGGARNRALRAALASACVGRVQLTDDVGLPGTYREAACFAVLGALCQDRVPITLPGVTGCRSPAPVCGAWVYPPGS